MLSRRNIRIKVMQTLYALNRDEALDLPQAISNYYSAIDESYRLYLFNLLQMVEVSEYNLKDQKKRSSKHLPTDEDLAFQPRLFHNPIIQFLKNNKDLADACEKKAKQENRTRLGKLRKELANKRRIDPNS